MTEGITATSSPPASAPSKGLLDRPIFIVGSARSGTTILSHMLEQHPDVAYIEEARLTWRYGNDDRSDMLRPEDARPEVIQDIRSEFERMVREQGKVRLVEKSPANALRLGFVRRVFPDARFIHIIRNGYDASLSIRKFWVDHAYGLTGLAPGRIRQRLKEVRLRRLPKYGKEVARRILPKRFSKVLGHSVWGPRIPGIDQLVAHLELLEVCALQWRMCVEAGCMDGRAMPSEQYFECRLEDLDESALRSILDFCELEAHPGIQAFFQKEFDASKSGARRPDADPAEIEMLRRWIEPTMKWLGYETA